MVMTMVTSTAAKAAAAVVVKAAAAAINPRRLSSHRGVGYAFKPRSYSYLCSRGIFKLAALL
ncbi:hypothetical protein, partial [Salmonella enterica]|uniref:hypothetical protein n=1 Tax=Salmonella enterica TaxID=28901 RepID=UPI0021BF64F1